MSRFFDAEKTRFGGWLEDFEAGDVYRHWPGKTVTEAEDHLFCALTMAESPLHIDAHFGRERMSTGRNVVVGTFVYALLLGLSVRDISGRAMASLGASDLRHVAPFFHGDTLYGETEVLSVRLSQTRPDSGVLSVRTVGTNQAGQAVCRFDRAVLLPRCDAQVDR